MATVFGNTISLKASESKALEKLASYRTSARDIISQELAKRASEVAVQLGRQVALLIERDGNIAHVILGESKIVYLPDLGRFRLSKARLRRLRLVVFLPEIEGRVKQYSNSSNSFATGLEQKVRAPEIAQDLVTDLEKLRFDIVSVIAPADKGGNLSISCVHLQPIAATKEPFGAKLPSKELTFFHLADLYRLQFDFEFFVEDLENRFRLAHSAEIELGSERTIIVGAYTNAADGAASISELEELAITAGVAVVDRVTQIRKKLDPKTVIGRGKLESIVLHALDLGVDLLIFDRELSAGQLRSITNQTELRVIDRSMLILDIFAQRAVTSEGRLQVELAQLRYSLPRLTETDTGLSRLTGGIGGRGPGETKLEVGRRRIRKRIADLEKKMAKVSSQRDLRRERRRERGVPVVGLVGYTNAGKSTLLNTLTSSKVFVESKLFATLDPTTRRMRFPDEREVVFVDTVGFIRELPKELLNAFKATLEEIGEADVLLHVVDSSNIKLDGQIEVVKETLEGLDYGDKPAILVFSKSDLISELEMSILKTRYQALFISSTSRVGLDKLILKTQELLGENFKGLDPGSFIADYRG